MSQFGQRPELGSRLFALTAFVVPGVTTSVSVLGGAVGPVSAIKLQAPKTNTLPIEYGPPGFVAGNGQLLYPGDSVLIKIDDAQNLAVVDPAASGLQTLRVLEID